MTTRTATAQVYITDDTAFFVDCLTGPRQHDEHCKGWRWHVYVGDNSKRMDAVNAAVRDLIAARRVTTAPTLIPQKVPARYMQPGDVVGSGETVVSVSAGVRTPRGKVEVVLERDGNRATRRLAVWGSHTAINVRRAA